MFHVKRNILFEDKISLLTFVLLVVKKLENWKVSFHCQHLIMDLYQKEAVGMDSMDLMLLG
jgi:hypothetical protein